MSEATGEASRVRLPFQTLGLWRRTNVGKKEKRSKETDTRKIRTWGSMRGLSEECQLVDGTGLGLVWTLEDLL